MALTWASKVNGILTVVAVGIAVLSKSSSKESSRREWGVSKRLKAPYYDINTSGDQLILIK